MLHAKSIELSYGASLCLRGVDLIAEPGKITCVLGRNGVGKSSLMRSIMGVERISAGVIEWEGRDIARLGPADRARAARPGMSSTSKTAAARSFSWKARSATAGFPPRSASKRGLSASAST